jgi:hypothetical protein
MQIARGIAGFLVGYALVVVITTVGFGWLDPYKPYHRAGLLVMAAATAVTIVAGLSGGGAAALIARRRLAGVLVAVPLIAESIWLLFFREHPDGAFAFEAVGAITLVASTILGSRFPAFYGALKTTSPPTTV